MQKRYERNINSLSPLEVDLLSTKKVAIIGCGGLGGYIIEHMARIGVGNLTVVDKDVFDESNLNRQILSDVYSIGMKKSKIAKDRVEKINPNVNVKDYEVFLDYENGIEILKGQDAVADALDNIKSKLMLQKICKELNIPLVHGSIAGWYGQIMTIFPCDDTLNNIYKDDLESGIEKFLGNLPFTASLVASMQSSEIIKILLKRGEMLRNCMLLVDCLNMEFEKVEFKK